MSRVEASAKTSHRPIFDRPPAPVRPQPARRTWQRRANRRPRALGFFSFYFLTSTGSGGLLPSGMPTRPAISTDDTIT
jgi:hypothetical protein